MAETRSRTIRLDDEVYHWLHQLPGKSLNDGLRALMNGGGAIGVRGDDVAEILELVRGLPENIEQAIQRVVNDTETRPVADPPAEKDHDGITCQHCGKPASATMCKECGLAGHWSRGGICRKCLEEERLRKKAARDSISDGSNVDYSVFND